MDFLESEFMTEQVDSIDELTRLATKLKSMEASNGVGVYLMDREMLKRYEAWKNSEWCLEFWVKPFIFAENLNRKFLWQKPTNSSKMNGKFNLLFSSNTHEWIYFMSTWL